MKYSELYNKIQFQFFVLLPFGIVFAILALLYGCQQQTQEQAKQKPSISMENLQTAYAKSIRHEHMYTLFAQKSEKEHFTAMSTLYRAIALSEKIHAQRHAALLNSHGVETTKPNLDSLTVGTTLQTLKMALSSESIEVESMYPNLAHTAELENFQEAADQFKQVQDADARQMELLKDASNKNGKIQKTLYYVCPGCGYILTSDKTEECPTCHAKKDKFSRI